mmetsp:Transcript_55245/g.145026  ORF Transcript_55245/g.145026 Transcript_55245/m.145026 type:complete len:180 (-) Transcript_55245:5-544(-)
MQAERPFRQKNLTPRVGPGRWSFDRIEEEWGDASLSCITYFRFRSVTDLRRLARALRLPPSFSVGSGKHTYLFTGEEGLLILLHRMSYPCTLSRMCWESGRGTTALSLGFRWMNEYIYNNFRHLHDDRSLLAWEPHFERFARAVYQKARGPDGSGIGLQNCVGFIDGTVQRVARPGSSY